jgi:hypothetical protein
MAPASSRDLPELTCGTNLSRPSFRDEDASRQALRQMLGAHRPISVPARRIRNADGSGPKYPLFAYQHKWSILYL